MGNRRNLLAIFALLALALGGASLAWACTPHANLYVEPFRGLPGSVIQVRGQAWVHGPVNLYWDARVGTPAKTTVGPEFNEPMTVPQLSPGMHYIIAVGSDIHGVYEQVQPFRVLDPDAAETSPPSNSDPAAGSEPKEEPAGSTSESNPEEGAPPADTEQEGQPTGGASSSDDGGGSEAGSNGEASETGADESAETGGESSTTTSGGESSTTTSGAESSAGSGGASGTAPAAVPPASDTFPVPGEAGDLRDRSGDRPASANPPVVVTKAGTRAFGGSVGSPLPSDPMIASTWAERASVMAYEDDEVAPAGASSAAASSTTRSITGDLWGGFGAGDSRSLLPSLSGSPAPGDDAGSLLPVGTALFALGIMGLFGGLVTAELRRRRPVAATTRRGVR